MTKAWLPGLALGLGNQLFVLATYISLCSFMIGAWSLKPFKKFYLKTVVMNLIPNVEKKKMFPGKCLRIARCFYRAQERERNRE